jgi:hypothetical protein
VRQINVETDHLIVWGDVDIVGRDVSRTLGLEPADGGTHPDQGTRNVLFAMDDDRFLEVLGPSRDTTGGLKRSFEDRAEGVLWWWAARSEGPLDDVRDRFERLGVDVGPIERGERIRPNGERLAWKTFDPAPQPFVPALPFVIEWDDAPPLRHQSVRCFLTSLQLLHPQPVVLATIADAVGLSDAVTVEPGVAPAARAVVTGPAGSLRLTTAAATPL